MPRIEAKTEKEFLNAIEKERLSFTLVPDKQLSDTQRLVKFNEILNANSLKSLKVVPNASITLTPAHPRTLDQLSYLRCFGVCEMRYSNLEPDSGCVWIFNNTHEEPTSFMIIHLSTIQNRTYGLEILVTSGVASYEARARGDTGNCSMTILDNENGTLTSFAIQPQMQPIVLGFKSNSKTKELTLIPDNSDIWLGFRYCKLTPLT